MGKTIWKYSINQKYSKIEMPKGSEVLSAKQQSGVMKIFALVDDSISETEEYIFHIFYTGEQMIDKDFVFLDTVIIKDTIVYHVFYEKP